MPKRCFKTNWMGLCLAGLLLAGCGSGDLDFKVRFEQVQGLKEQDPVIFQGNTAGEVLRLKYEKEGFYLVEVRVLEPFVAAATREARFLIVDHPGLADRKALEMVLKKKGGAPIASGETVEGAPSASNFLVQFLGNLEKSLGALAKDLSDDPKGAPLESMARRFQSMLEELEKAGASANDALDKELIPLIRRELERLKSRLDAMAEEAATMEEQLKSGVDDVKRRVAEPVDRLRAQFEAAIEAIRKVPDSEAMKALQAQLLDLARELAASGAEVKETIQKELIPLIEKELEALEEALKKDHREEEFAPVETAFESLREV